MIITTEKEHDIDISAQCLDTIAHFCSRKSLPSHWKKKRKKKKAQGVHRWRIVTNRPSAPWRTDSVRTARKELRLAERKWRSSDLTVYKELYSTKLIAYTASVRKVKRQYYNDVIRNCPSFKQLYKFTNQLLGRTKKTSLPNNTPPPPPVICPIDLSVFQQQSWTN